MPITYDANRTPRIRVQLELREINNFKPEWKGLLQHGFGDETDIAVTQKLSGYSEAYTYLIQVTTNKNNLQSFVVKIARRPIIDLEYANVQQVDGNGCMAAPSSLTKDIPSKINN